MHQINAIHFLKTDLVKLRQAPLTQRMPRPCSRRLFFGSFLLGKQKKGTTEKPNNIGGHASNQSTHVLKYPINQTTASTTCATHASPLQPQAFLWFLSFGQTKERDNRQTETCKRPRQDKIPLQHHYKPGKGNRW